MELSESRSMSLSLTELDVDLSEDTYLHCRNNCEDKLVHAVHSPYPMQEQGTHSATCQGRAPADGGSDPISSPSLAIDGDLAVNIADPHETCDLEADNPPDTDPPSYSNVMSRSAGGGGFHPLTTNPASSPTVVPGRRRRVDSGQAQPLRVSSPAVKKRTRGTPKPKEPASCPAELNRVHTPASSTVSSKSSGDAKSSTADQNKTKPGRVRAKATSKSGQERVTQLTLQPNGTRILVNGRDCVTVKEGPGNIVITNNINLGHAGSTASRTRQQRNVQKRPRTSLPAADSTRKILSQDIEILARLLGDNWKNIGLSIGVEPGVLENIKSECGRDQQDMARQMLQKWTHRFGHNATINYVIDALLDDKFNMYDVALQLPKDKTT